MKRAVLCVPNPQDYMSKLDNYSIMVINPGAPASRNQYLLENSDYSLLITQQGETYRDGGDYLNEKVVWCTSGTTGDSKFRSFSQEQLNIMSATMRRSYEINSNDRYLSLMPLWHAHGQAFYWVTQDAKCEVKYITPTEFKNQIDFDPTFISAIPDFLRVLMKQDFKNLRFVRSASSPLSDSLFQELRSWSNAPVIEAFGMTETCSHCFTNPLHGEQRIGTVGLPDGIDAKIVDGVLHVQGPCVFTPGWYDTQDLAEQDEKGYYKIVGRVDDVINIRGIKYNPASLEQQLKAHIPELQECVIFGKECIKCLYVGDVDPVCIEKFLMRLSPQCRPKLLQQVESIPLNATGKISRTYLWTRYK